MEKMVYTIKEVAGLLGISQSYAYEMVRKGVIPSLQVGSKRVIPKTKFNTWVNGDQTNKKELR